MSPTSFRILLQRRRHSAAGPSAHERYGPTAQPRRDPVTFVELDMRQNDGYTVSLEWHRDTGTTRIVIDDIRVGTQLVFPVPAVSAGDAFRHPFRYAP